MMALATLLPFTAIFFLSFSKLCKKKVIETEKHCYMCVCVCGGGPEWVKFRVEVNISLPLYYFT